MPSVILVKSVFKNYVSRVCCILGSVAILSSKRKQNRATHLNRATRTISARFKQRRRADVFTHRSRDTKQRCEIQ